MISKVPWPAAELVREHVRGNSAGRYMFSITFEITLRRHISPRPTKLLLDRGLYMVGEEEGSLCEGRIWVEG